MKEENDKRNWFSPAAIWRRIKSIAQARAQLGWTGTRVFLLLVVATVAVVTLLVAMAPEPELVAQEETAWEVNTMVAEPAAIAPELRLVGRVETPRVSSLASALAAEVREVPAVEGQHVEQGDVLVVLDDRDARLMAEQRRADVEEAHANLASLQLAGKDDQATLEHQRKLVELTLKDLKRHKELRQNSAVSETLFDTIERQAHQQAIALRQAEGAVDDFANRLAMSEARLRRSQALLAEAELAVQRTRIRSPYHGRVARVVVAPGERVSPGEVVVDVYDTAALEVRAQIPGRALTTVRNALGTGAATRLPAKVLTQPILDASLNRLSGQVDSGTAGVDGLFRVQGGATLLEVGRVVELELHLPAVDSVIAAPEQAIFGEDRVYLVEEGRLRGVTVERVGRADGDEGERVLIRSADIHAGAQILTTQLGNAMTGLRVATDDPAEDASSEVGTDAVAAR
ncbi:MAG: HlyD family efflux transporter periplasmic adaptor subunit [Gammaproteobacteria bacterium]|nr:HlyD family efflux transporter periplasmic adaptor subunit [Gammaproteobacteria bacterium]